MPYQHREIETKWQTRWDEEKVFRTREEDLSKPKYYVLDMFPYPSGAGLHVGHPEGYTATDIVARFKRMQGYNVLHPMGWDAFGLPAEQYALDTGNNPRDFTQKNIAHFKEQIRSLGFSYDWDREINTTDPAYYRWTQWIFLKLYEMGLAYIDEVPVWWCPALGTVLANEEVINGRSERGNHPVERRPMKQWMLRITAYADRLLEDLETLDWPEHIKEMQRNWIGRSEGAEIVFGLPDRKEKILVFSTRPDTLFGATYLVLAPEHPLVDHITTEKKREEVLRYREEVKQKSDLERTDLAKAKTGVFTGAYALHPVTGEKVPIWIADYVLIHYGTGAIMAVPGHDERDYEFAVQFGLPIVEVVKGGDLTKGAYTGDGEHIHSDFLNGLKNKEAIAAMIDWLAAHGKGERKVTYRLRDWLFSRQRYWGEPIPILHMEDGSIEPVPYEHLPLTLPETDQIRPSGTGESPLATMEEWVHVVDEKGRRGRRETNTMPQWAGSSWYFLRFIDPHNQERFADPEKLKYWLPVDLYIGGAEHAVLHLLYARFWHKVLYDLGLVSTKEPFQKLFNQGMILGANHEKMSKSKGNVVNPDEIILSHGADALRLYEMFMGPLDASKAWSTTGLDGARRFLDRIWRLYVTDEGEISPAIQDEVKASELERVYHKTIKKVTEDFEQLHFNTAISQLMIFINEAYKQEKLPREYMEGFVKLLSPIAPHLGEELWERLGHRQTITYERWPAYDPEKLIEDEVEIVVQINGRVRSKLSIPKSLSPQEMQAWVLKDQSVHAHLEGKKVKKVIPVPGKLVNIVVEG